MSTIVGVAVGCVVTQAGFYTGMIYSRIRYRRKLTEVPKAICGCEHSLAEHDPATGVCHHVSRKHIGWQGSVDQYEKVPCNCRQYVGPRPFELMMALPTLPPTDYVPKDFDG